MLGEIKTVRQVFRRTIGFSNGGEGQAFEPFSAAALNTYLLKYVSKSKYLIASKFILSKSNGFSLNSLLKSGHVKGQLNSEWMYEVIVRFSQNANQKFEGFLPWKFIRG